jgi:plasmid maintenance system antidote protein VapI
MRIKNGMRPVHPGEVLREDFLRPSGLTANALAKALHVPRASTTSCANGAASPPIRPCAWRDTLAAMPARG